MGVLVRTIEDRMGELTRNGAGFESKTRGPGSGDISAKAASLKMGMELGDDAFETLRKREARALGILSRLIQIVPDLHAVPGVGCRDLE
ncbi:MAG: hypothetical protein BGO71_25370 [Burkholderiales bacterium 67-32]|nr:MAG: hypothetical protein BGO71_25370 [Burkholderiales bacterium 67-32]